MKMRIVVDKTVPFLQGIVEDFAEVVYLQSQEFTPEAIHDADALIVRSVDKCSKVLLKNSRVKLITSATIGFDHIDTAFCEEKGIVWKNAPGCNAVSVAQYVISSLIAVAQRKEEPLQGKTIGIIGLGHVGQEVEKVCSAFGMNILRNDPPRAKFEEDKDYVSLDIIAEKADVITIHTPLTREGRYATYHLINDSFLNKLKRKPWYINAARGAVNDTAALLKAKDDGKVGELIIDCWENEPTVNIELLKLATIATPHIAGFSADGKANGTRACLENIASFFNLKSVRVADVKPLSPDESIIDMDIFGNNRLERAVFHCFKPLLIDEAMRLMPERFEWFRSYYAHPREFHAYKIKNATSQEAAVLQNLGFNIM